MCKKDTVNDFLSTTGKLGGLQDGLPCDTKIPALNNALSHLRLDAYKLSEFEEIHMLGSGGTHTDTTEYPIYSISSFGGYANGNCCNSSCIDYSEDNDCASCSNEEKLGRLSLTFVGKGPKVLSGQYAIPCPFGNQIVYSIPECIDSAFMKYHRYFDTIMSGNDEMPISRPLRPALYMLLLFYNLPTMGTGFDTDSDRYFSAYQNYIAKLYESENKPIPSRFVSKAV